MKKIKNIEIPTIPLDLFFNYNKEFKDFVTLPCEMDEASALYLILDENEKAVVQLLKKALKKAKKQNNLITKKNILFY